MSEKVVLHRVVSAQNMYVAPYLKNYYLLLLFEYEHWEYAHHC
jgi:hypothetical protein